MAKAKNIYTILRNIDFDGTCKYIEGRIQMTNAGFEFNVQEHLFTFAQKFYNEVLKHHDQSKEDVLLENEHLSFELNEVMTNLKEFNRFLDEHKETINRMNNLLKEKGKISPKEFTYLKAKETILGQFELALKQNNLKL